MVKPVFHYTVPKDACDRILIDCVGVIQFCLITLKIQMG